MANIMKQVTGTIKTVVSKAAPVAKVVGGFLLAGGIIIAGVNHYNDRRKAADETMEDLEPINETAEEISE